MVTPLGVGREVFWSHAVAGRSATRLIQAFDASAFRSQVAGECLDFDPLAIVAANEVPRLDRFSLFALAAAQEAMEDSGLAADSDRTGVVLGNGMGGAVVADQQREISTTKGPRWIYPLTVPIAMPNAAAAQVGMRFKLRGPSLTISTACASGANAIGEAYRMIAHDHADAMLAGGTEAAISRGIYSVWDALRVMAQRNDDPAGASRPFDKDRTGFVMAEGCAILVLEELSRAVARGAPIYAELAGYGCTNDAYHVTRPSLEGETTAIRLALRDAGVAPETVDYVNAHGTATAANDATETLALKAVFGERAAQIPISSTKSMIGHSIGAAGAIEAACTCLTIQRGLITPTINLETPDPECDLDYVPNHSRPAAIEVAVSNSFGFGGSNAILVMRRLASM